MKTLFKNVRPWRRVFATLGLAALLLAAAATWVWLSSRHSWLPITQDLHINIDGQDWEGADAVALLSSGWGWLAGLGGLLVGAVVGLVSVAAMLLLVVPLVLAFSVGLPLLIVAAVLALAFSPLWLLVLLLIWLLRPARHHATIRP
jgi:hypothetical protein